MTDVSKISDKDLPVTSSKYAAEVLELRNTLRSAQSRLSAITSASTAIAASALPTNKMRVTFIGSTLNIILMFLAPDMVLNEAFQAALLQVITFAVAYRWPDAPNIPVNELGEPL
ncbi:MAG: hypothetical protein AAFR68_04160 [Pseudomonadota bacterium]